MILVVGATSRVGTRLIPLLIQRGYTVRAMTRTPEKAASMQALGAEVVQGDLRDPSSLARACQGIDQVIDAAHGFMPVQPGNDVHTVDDAGNRSLVEAARAAGVKQFVFISILGLTSDASMELFRIKYATEQYLKASGLSYTILRAGPFMELWAAIVGEPILKTGKTTIFGAGNNPISFVSAADVAKFVLLAIEDPRASNQIIEVGGPENLTFNQVAALFEKLSGRPGSISHIPLPVMRIMKVVMSLFNPSLSTQIAGGINFDTENQAFDMRPTLQKYPMQLTRLEEVARQMVQASPS